MTVTTGDEPRVVSARRDVAAAPDTLLELVADPSEQPRWHGRIPMARATTSGELRASIDRLAALVEGP